MAERESAGIVPAGRSLGLDRVYFGARLVKVDRDAEQEIGVADGEFAPFSRSGGIHDRRQTIKGARKGIDALAVEEAPAPVKRAVVRPDLPYIIEPFLR